MSRLPAISRFIRGGPPGLAARAALVRQIFRNTRSIPSASTGLEQLHLCDEILKLPRDLPGAVIELGCYRGSATATLSLACRHAGRKLIVCDSFQGLPDLAPGEDRQSNPWNANPNTYSKGEYAGSLAQVKDAVQRFGAIEVCTFVEGFFSDTLRSFQKTSLWSLRTPISFPPFATSSATLGPAFSPAANSSATKPRI